MFPGLQRFFIPLKRDSRPQDFHLRDTPKGSKVPI